MDIDGVEKFLGKEEPVSVAANIIGDIVADRKSEVKIEC